MARSIGSPVNRQLLGSCTRWVSTLPRRRVFRRPRAELPHQQTGKGGTGQHAHRGRGLSDRGRPGKVLPGDHLGHQRGQRRLGHRQTDREQRDQADDGDRLRGEGQRGADQSL
jgi:hypothetical protein